MPSVYVTRRLAPEVIGALEVAFEIVLNDEEWPPPREEVLAYAAGKDGLLTMTNDPVDDQLFDAAGPQLRVVANHGVGFDNVDLEAATQRGVVVTNTPRVLARATAELTIAILLDLVRRVSEGDRLVRAGTPWIWSPTFMVGASLQGKTIGIVGLGRIGRDVAHLGKAFGMRVVYASRSDVPGCGYEREPQVHDGLLNLDNAVLAPHLGSGTHETRLAMGMLCVEGLRAVLLEDRCPANALNPHVLAVRT